MGGAGLAVEIEEGVLTPAQLVTPSSFPHEQVYKRCPQGVEHTAILAFRG